MTDPSPTRIAMWSGPRNISTALMRAWENRPDTAVVDEPFYGAYLARTGIDHPGRDCFLPMLNTDPEAVVQGLMGEVPRGSAIYYQKHMAHHLPPDMDHGWLAGVTNAFLIRDPAAVLTSYAKARPDVTLDDLGYTQQVEIFNREADRLGEAPPVIEGDQILKAPEAALTALCDRLGVPFDHAMLSWPAGPRDSDGPWAPWWYRAVEASTKFMRRPPEPTALPDALRPLADAAQPLYEALRHHRLTV